MFLPNRQSRTRFIFEQAKPEDAGGLLEILENAAFKGNISLLYTRRPNAYQSLKREGKEVDIVVARDTENGKISGFGACAIRKLYVNGEEEQVGYLFGLRVARDYIGKFPILHRGYGYLRQLHDTKHISCYITTILEENSATQKLLEKPRRFMPTYQPFGVYEIFALKTTTVPQTSSFASLHFRQAEKDDLHAIITFLNQQGKRHQFYPVLEQEDFYPNNILHLTTKNFYLLHTDQDEIMAAGIPWNQQDYKQYVVQGYGGVLKLLYPFSRFFPLLGFPVLPKPQDTLKFFTLSFWAIKDNTPGVFLQFLNRISQHFRNYPFFLAGVHERHPLRHVLQKQPHISYSSNVYLVHWDEHHEFVQHLNREMLPYIECGML